jgi:hypothetical protein
MHRSGQDGEGDLYRLLANARREEHWWYFPETQTWVAFHTDHSEQNNMTVSSSTVEYTPFGNQEVSYHIHPLHGWVRKDEKEFRESLRTQYPPNIIEELLLLGKSVPSADDYVCAYSMPIVGQCPLELRIITPVGRFSMVRTSNETPDVARAVSDISHAVQQVFDPDALTKGRDAAIRNYVQMVNTRLNTRLRVEYIPRSSR